VRIWWTGWSIASLYTFDSHASNAPTRWIAPLQPANSLGTVGLYFFLRITGDSSRESVQHHYYLWDSFSNSAVRGLILAACHKIGANGFQPFNLRDSWWRHRRLLVDQRIALAQTAGWESLTVPNCLCGNIGYAVASFIGLALLRDFK
jgi:hypothetical protein